MSTLRVYCDSRDRKSGSATFFEYALPYSLAIQEKSLANIDVVVVPNSIQTVIAGVNDLIYLRENSQLDQVWHRTPRIAPGYYTIDTLALAVRDALNDGTKMPGEYTVVYNVRLGRLEFNNTAQRFGYFFTIFTYEVQVIAAASPAAPPILENGNGAWRLLGAVTGLNITVPGDQDEIPAIGNDAPNLQYATQLFIKTSLGVAAQSVGPKGNMSINRRVVVDVPTFALVVDRHSTSWDSFQIPGNTTISSFTVQMCDYNGSVVDLNGQSWSFSISIFREDILNCI